MEKLKSLVDQYESIGDTSFTFPALTSVITSLLGAFRSGAITEDWRKIYDDWVKRVGGPKAVEDLLLDSMDDEVKALQGQLITVQRLEEVKRSRPDIGDLYWSQPGGYLGFLTYDRDNHYQRYYVGQSTNMISHIRRHTTAMLYGDVSTLLYYIHALGGGHRKPNSVRFFCIAGDSTEIDGSVRHDTLLKMNMLEMTMALAFNSLPRAILEKYLPPNLISSKHPTIHLNVATPLLQLEGHDHAARAGARGKMLSSADPEVRSWTSFRNDFLSGRESSTAHSAAPPLRCDFLKALKEAIHTVDFELDTSTFLCDDIDKTLPLGADLTIKDYVSACAANILAESVREASLFMPLGSLRDSIAVIFGQPTQQPGDDVSVALDQRLPPGLQELGFSANNSLIWPFLPHKAPLMDTYNVALTATLHRHYQEVRWSILSSSLAKVVLVWGLEAQAGVFDFDQVHGLSPVTFISLRGSKLPIRLEYEGRFIRRVFFHLPDFQGLTLRHNWRVQEIVRFTLLFTAIITNTPWIKVSLFEQHCVRTQILHDLYNEQSTTEKLTVDTFNDNVRRWLYCKGFVNKEDIVQLQQLGGGSLPQAIHMRFVSIPKGKPDFTKEGLPRERFAEKKIVYSKPCLQAIRNLYLEKEVQGGGRALGRTKGRRDKDLRTRSCE